MGVLPPRPSVRVLPPLPPPKPTSAARREQGRGDGGQGHEEEGDGARHEQAGTDAREVSHPLGPGAALTASLVPALPARPTDARHVHVHVLVISRRMVLLRRSGTWTDLCASSSWAGARSPQHCVLGVGESHRCRAKGCCAPRAAWPTPRVATAPLILLDSRPTDECTRLAKKLL